MVINVIILIILAIGAYISAYPFLYFIGQLLGQKWLVQDPDFLLLWNISAAIVILGCLAWYLIYLQQALTKAVLQSVGIWLISSVLWVGIILIVISNYHLWNWQLLLYWMLPALLISALEMRKKK
ncbi:MAG: hypothetical protein AB8E82_10125 [Aureispira sp.]